MGPYAWARTGLVWRGLVWRGPVQVWQGQGPTLPCPWVHRALGVGPYALAPGWGSVVYYRSVGTHLGAHTCPAYPMPLHYTLIAISVGTLLGVLMGWALGLHAARRELAQYKAGQRDEHERHTQAANSGPCWVRAQLPPHAEE